MKLLTLFGLTYFVLSCQTSTLDNCDKTYLYNLYLFRSISTADKRQC